MPHKMTLFSEKYRVKCEHFEYMFYVGIKIVIGGNNTKIWGESGKIINAIQL